MTAAIQVEVGFGSTWQTEPADITWTDVSSYVLLDSGIVMQRGASSARGQVDVGTMRLSLLNSDRRFDPTYTAGPYYGNLKPGVPIRVKTGFADDLSWGDDLLMWDTDYMIWVGATTMLWRGTVSGWPQRYDVGNTMSWVPLSCYDGFDKLARAKIPRTVLEAAIMADAPVAYWPIAEQSGQLMADVSGNGYHGTYNQGATQLATKIEPAGGGPVQGIEWDGEHYGVVTGPAPALAAPMVVEAFVFPGEGTASDSSVVLQMGNGNPTGFFYLRVSNYSSGGAIVGGLAVVTDGEATSNHPTGTILDAPSWVTYRLPAASPAVLYENGVDVTGITDTRPTSTTSFSGAAVATYKAATSDGRYVGFVSNVAVFDSDIGATRIAAHSAAALAPLDGQTTDERIDWILDELNWPTNLRSLRTGVAELGPATFKPGDNALAYLRQIEQTEDGRLFINPDGEIRFVERYWRYLAGNATTVQFTFTDTPGGTGYAEFDLDVDDDLLVNVARFTRRDGTEQVATNTASVASYGEAELQRNDLLLTTDAEVLSLAEWTVATQSTPLPRCPKIRVPISRYLGPDATDVLTLDLGHRVQVSRTPQGVGSAITIDLVVDGIRIEIGNAGIWWEAFVSPVPEDTVPLAIYDTSVYDGTDVYAP